MNTASPIDDVVEENELNEESEDEPEDEVNEESDDDPEDEDEDNEESEESDEESIDVWSRIIRHAARESNIKSPVDATREPFLGEFVNHMKDYVEQVRKFWDALNDDETFNIIESDMENATIDQDEAAELAWQNRRFRLRKIIQDHLDVIKEEIDNKEEMDENSSNSSTSG